MKCLKKNILIKREKRIEETKGGIVVHTYGEYIDNVGIIESIGEEVKEDVKIGDKVLFSKFAGDEVEIEGEKFLFIEEGDLLGKYET